MNALKIIFGMAVIAVIVALLASPFLLERHAKEKFGHSLFTRCTWYIGMASAVPMWIGHFWIVLAEKYKGEYTEKYAWGLITFGIAISGYLLYKNIHGTTLRYGVGVSLIQIPALLILSTLAVPALAIVGLMAADGAAEPMDDQERYNRYFNPNDARYAGNHTPLGERE